MKSHAAYDTSSRTEYFQEICQEIQGRMPKGPFEFSSSLGFPELKNGNSNVKAVARFKKAVYRDATYAAAGPIFIKLFGFNQALRTTYEGGKNIIDGGGS